MERPRVGPAHFAPNQTVEGRRGAVNDQEFVQT